MGRIAAAASGAHRAATPGAARPLQRRCRMPHDPACPIGTQLGRPATKATSPLRRGLLVVLGSLSLATGIVGIFVPLLPTTCFLLFAAWCYARSSDRLYARLMALGWVGRYLRDYREGRGIPARVKGASLGMMWMAIGYAGWRSGSPWLIALLLLVAALVTAHVLRLPVGAARAGPVR